MIDEDHMYKLVQIQIIIKQDYHFPLLNVEYNVIEVIDHKHMKSIFYIVQVQL